MTYVNNTGSDGSAMGTSTLQSAGFKTRPICRHTKAAFLIVQP